MNTLEPTHKELNLGDFKATGHPGVDRILAAVARAAESTTNTREWGEGDPEYGLTVPGLPHTAESARGLIQAVADKVAGDQAIRDQVIIRNVGYYTELIGELWANTTLDAPDLGDLYDPAFRELEAVYLLPKTTPSTDERLDLLVTVVDTMNTLIDEIERRDERYKNESGRLTEELATRMAMRRRRG